METTFAALGVAPGLVDALKQDGIETPFAIQTLTLPDAIAGLDICGKAKTGSGKTLAFGLPLLGRVSKAKPHRPTGLILVPTRELANQVCTVLAPLASAVGRSVTAVYGGMGFEPQIAALAGGVDAIVGTPGRLIDLMERKEVEFTDIEGLVLDEADRMADMGFMPQVQKILYGLSGDHQTMLFSATLDGGVKQIVARYMRDPIFYEVESDEPTVDEMEHRFLFVHDMDKVKVAAAIANNSNRTLMFCNYKRTADKLVRDLSKEGINAAAIHGDLSQAARERSLVDFSSGKVKVLVATDVAARGIHVDGVDVVIHYEPTDDHKAYIHRSGRTARAGESGVAVTLMLWNEENAVRGVQRRLGLSEPIVEMFSNDPRLFDLRGWDPKSESATPAS